MEPEQIKKTHLVVHSFLTTRQAAELLNVTVQTVRRWIGAGIIHGHRLGSRFRVPASEIMRLQSQGGQGGEQR